VGGIVQRRSISRYTPDVRNHKQPGGLKAVSLIAIAIGLVLLLLVPHVVSHHGASVVCFLLVPIFLFGKIESGEEDILPIEENGRSPSRSQIRSQLFQRPPPLIVR
jgi:hypothetical protein